MNFRGSFGTHFYDALNKIKLKEKKKQKKQKRNRSFNPLLVIPPLLLSVFMSFPIWDPKRSVQSFYLIFL